LSPGTRLIWPVVRMPMWPPQTPYIALWFKNSVLQHIWVHLLYGEKHLVFQERKLNKNAAEWTFSPTRSYTSFSEPITCL